jgi:acyl dehydratase
MKMESLDISTVLAGDKTHEIELPLTLQRLVMEAGANRDFSLIHHDKEVAKNTGAPDAYANTFFLMGMFERLLREFIGPAGQIQKLGPMRMTAFNVVGDTIKVSGSVTAVDRDLNRVSLNLQICTDKGATATCEAQVEL